MRSIKNLHHQSKYGNIISLIQKGYLTVTEDQIKQNIAKNIASLRKEKEMTQADLAVALNYSDKSISKWERGEGLPDVLVLCKIADLFGVAINDLISEKAEIKKEHKIPHLSSRIIIPLLSVGLVFLVFSVIFLCFRIFLPEFTMAWLFFIFAIPVACIPLLVFSCVWWDLPQRFFCVTALTWSVVLFLRLTFEISGIDNIFITASIFQVLTILWFILRFRSKRRKKKQQSNAGM